MSEDIVKIALPGAGGRMGQMISSLIAQNHDMHLSAAAERNGSPWVGRAVGCLLYTSPSPRDLSTSRMPSSA